MAVVSLNGQFDFSSMNSGVNFSEDNSEIAQARRRKQERVQRKQTRVADGVSSVINPEMEGVNASSVIRAAAEHPLIQQKRPGEEKTAYWYQLKAIEEAKAALKDGYRRIAICLPTGGGKTYTAKELLKTQVFRDVCGVKEGQAIRVLFASHLDRLLRQAELEIGNDPLIDLTLQSAFKGIPEEVLSKGWDVVVIDEAHHEAMSSYQTHLEMMGRTPIIGLTATPDRDDGRLIKFSVIVDPISRAQAVDEGFLAQSVINTVIDEAGTDKTEELLSFLKTYAPMMGKTLVFVRTRREVEAITAFLEKSRYKVMALLSQSKLETNRALEAFDNNEVQFLVNCAKIDEGVDLKGCTDVVLGRNYGTKRMINQVIGRASRPDSPCVVWELVDPFAKKYTAEDVITNPKERYLIHFDHSAQQWSRSPYEGF